MDTVLCEIPASEVGWRDAHTLAHGRCPCHGNGGVKVWLVWALRWRTDVCFVTSMHLLCWQPADHHSMRRSMMISAAMQTPPVFDAQHRQNHAMRVCSGLLGALPYDGTRHAFRRHADKIALRPLSRLTSSTSGGRGRYWQALSSDKRI